MNNSISNRREFAKGLVLDDGFLPDVFEVMLDAWTRVRIPEKGIREPRITALWKIQCRIVNQTRYREVGSLFEFDFLHEEQENDPDTGKQISRKDITVRVYGPNSANSRRRNADYLVVESKKLTGADDITEYIGNDGMLRFITRKYDPFQSFVAMAAYVMDGEIDKWKGDVLNRIETSAGLKTIGTDLSWTILSKHPQHSTTRHTVDNKSISIHHLFLKSEYMDPKE